jgi:CheY-like chemotaxis protein
MAQESLSDFRILVAEDHLMLQRLVQSLCTRWGISLVLASDGLEAMEQSKKIQFNIILLDINMPKMSGFEVSEQIRSDLENPNNKTPIVAVTALESEIDTEKFKDAGMTNWLQKPFNPNQLHEMILNTRVENKVPLEKAFKLNDDQLDQELLFRLYENDLAYQYEMFASFLLNIDNHMTSLRSAIGIADRDSIIKNAHRLKPMFAMVGLATLSSICEMLEKNCQADKKTVDLSKLLSKLDSIYPNALENVAIEAKRIKKSL